MGIRGANSVPATNGCLMLLISKKTHQQYTQQSVLNILRFSHHGPTHGQGAALNVRWPQCIKM